jgi:hypothetical protein
LDEGVFALPAPGLSPHDPRRRAHRHRPVALAALVGAALMAAGAAPIPAPDGAAAEQRGVLVRRFPAQDLFSVLGEEVRSAAGADMGRIVDVLADETGRPRAAVIDFGGFLGVGTRKIAVAWRALCFGGTQKHGIVLPDLTPDQLKSAPEYEASGKPVAVITPSPLIESGSDPCPGP